VTKIQYRDRIRLKSDCGELDHSATDLQLAKMQERKNALQRKINAWSIIQELYLPEVATLRARGDRDASDQTAEVAPYDCPLYLPSALPARITCSSKLREYEFKLREAQAYEALEEIRNHLRLRTHMYKYKDKNTVGQRANTRSQSMINRVQKKVNASAAKYNMARKAVSKLSAYTGEVGWRAKLLPLADDDIRPLVDTEGESEGRRKLTWIWKVVGLSDDDDEGVQEGTYQHLIEQEVRLTCPTLALRIEWCRSRARAMRWSEEVLLLREEMRRVLTFLEWDATRWETRVAEHTGLDDNVTEGMAAYANKQAHVRRSIASSFEQLWRHSPEFTTLGVGADNEILDLRLAASIDLLDVASIAEPST
jgi:hypothetical protein